MSNPLVHTDKIHETIIKFLSGIHGEDVSVYFENMMLREALGESLSQNSGQKKQGWLRRLKISLTERAKLNMIVVFTYYFLLPRIYNLYNLKGISLKDINSVFFSFAPNHLNAVAPVIEKKKSTSVVLSALIGRKAFTRNSSKPFHGRLFFYTDGFSTPSDFFRYHRKLREAKAGCGKLGNSISEQYGCNRPALASFLNNHIVFYYMNFFRYCLIGENISRAFSHCKFYFGNDSCHRSRAIIAGARKAGIKTVVVQHGVMNYVELYRPFSDIITVRGEIERTKLLEIGVEPARIRVTGSPVHSKTEPLKELNPEKLKILFATNPVLSVTERKSILNEVLKASRVLKAHLTVRPHPVEDPDIYRESRPDNYTVDKTSSLDNQLSTASIGIIITSTVGLDMALKGLPVLQFKVEELHDGTRFDSFEYVKPVRSSAEIIETVRSLIGIADLDEMRKEFIQSYISQFGERASDAIIAI